MAGFLAMSWCSGARDWSVAELNKGEDLTVAHDETHRELVARNGGDPCRARAMLSPMGRIALAGSPDTGMGRIRRAGPTTPLHKYRWMERRMVAQNLDGSFVDQQRHTTNQVGSGTPPGGEKAVRRPDTTSCRGGIGTRGTLASRGVASDRDRWAALEAGFIKRVRRKRGPAKELARGHLFMTS